MKKINDILYGLERIDENVITSAVTVILFSTRKISNMSFQIFFLSLEEKAENDVGRRSSAART